MTKYNYKRTDPMNYNDDIAREAVKNIKGQEGQYRLFKNNCQDWIDRFRDEYHRLENSRKKK